MEKRTEQLFDFLEKSITAFHAIENVKAKLDKDGFAELMESEHWNIEKGGKYYVTRNDSSIIAFKMPVSDFTGYQIVASHSDSPTFKIKESPEITYKDKYTKLNVEGYGGMICSPWFDRPLSVAGRVVAYKDGQVVSKLVNLDRDLVLIPNVAIHMNREINKGYKYSVQKDMLPIIGDGSEKGRLMELVAEDAGVEKDDIVGKDLFLYNRDKCSVWGGNGEYFSSPRIDNLECAYSTLMGFLEAVNITNPSVYCVFDNEEVGSSTKQGAASTFLHEVLKRICINLGGSEEDFYRYIASSFMVSADNAHAMHPNYPEKSDVENHTFMNEGIVVKHSANQKYTTDGVSRGVFKAIMQKGNIPVQDYVNHSDILGGSTLGSIANTKVSMNTIDIGLPQLAMHSPYETAGVKDFEYLADGIKLFYETDVKLKDSRTFVLG